MSRTPRTRSNSGNGADRPVRTPKRRTAPNRGLPVAGAMTASPTIGEALDVLPTKADKREFPSADLVLPDPAVLRLGVEASGSLVDRFVRMTFDALAESTEMNRRWAHETMNRIADLARPPERPDDVMHSLAGFMSAQGDLAAQQLARAAALLQRFHIETLGALAEAGQALADETASALHGGSGRQTKTDPHRRSTPRRE